MKFSKKSKAQLATCHEDLQRLFNEVIKHHDCTIIEGHRNQEDQDKYFKLGTTKLKWPHGNHNKTPSMAVDVMPYPIDWKDMDRVKEFGTFVLVTANILGIKINWGGNWKTFKDYPHYELK